MYSQRAYPNAIAAYQTAAETVSPVQAIVMLYDGAIQRISLAKEAIDNGQIETRYNSVMKAYAIIQGLQSHLDFDAGGDIAPQLDRYYEYLLVRMTMINLKNDPAICEEVIERLREMRASWSSIADGTASANDQAPKPVQTTSVVG